MYLNQLIVDANGVLVLLKFLNQDFSKIEQVSINHILEDAIEVLLSMMYKVRPQGITVAQVCKGQSERIKTFLVQYKAPVRQRGETFRS